MHIISHLYHEKRYVTLWLHCDINMARKNWNIIYVWTAYMFLLENEYKSVLPRNAHGTYKAACTKMVLVTWPRWPPCPYMVKTFKNFLLWNLKADDLETWYAASSSRVLPKLFKLCPWIDLDLFYGKVKFGLLCLCFGKC